MKILVTGFEPFGGAVINPAYEAVKLLPDVIVGAEVIKIEIPTVFGRDEEVVRAAVEKHHPDAVLCVGQAGGRSGNTVEKVAINLMEARIPDNEGKQPLDTPIREDGENAYFASLPVKSMVQYMKEAKIPARVSYTAGTFVCNDIMYRVLYMIDKEYPHMRGGFVHVPYLPEQTLDLPEGTPSMPAEMIAKALACGIRAIVENEADVKTISGETH